MSKEKITHEMKGVVECIAISDMLIKLGYDIDQLTIDKFMPVKMDIMRVIKKSKLKIKK